MVYLLDQQVEALINLAEVTGVWSSSVYLTAGKLSVFLHSVWILDT